jgi:hypothetical protein
MNKAIIEHLYKIYKLEKDWAGNKVNMTPSSGFFSSFEPSLYKLNCNDNISYYFNNMHKDKNGSIEVEVYSQSFKPANVRCSNGSEVDGGTSDLYRLENIYKFSVQINEETVKFMDVGFFSTSEITSPLKVQENSKIFMKGLEEYGFKHEKSGGKNRQSNKRKSNKRKSANRRSNKTLY